MVPAPEYTSISIKCTQVGSCLSLLVLCQVCVLCHATMHMTCDAAKRCTCFNVFCASVGRNAYLAALTLFFPGCVRLHVLKEAAYKRPASSFGGQHFRHLDDLRATLLASPPHPACFEICHSQATSQIPKVRKVGDSSLTLPSLLIPPSLGMGVFGRAKCNRT